MLQSAASASGADIAIGEPIKSREHEEDEVVGPRRPYAIALAHCAAADTAAAQRAG